MSILKAFLISILLMLIYSIIQVVLIYPAGLLIEDFKLLSIWNAFANIISSLVSYLIIFKIFWSYKLNFKEFSDLKKIDDNMLFYIVLIALGLYLINKPLWNILDIWKYYNYSELNLSEIEPQKIDIYFILRSLSILIVSPILEELFFRKFLISKLLEKNNLVISIILSSLLFSLIHIESFNNLLPTFIFGVISGLIFIKTKRIIYTIILHFLYNLIIQLLRVSDFPLDVYLNSLEFNSTYWIFIIFGAALVSFGIYRIFFKVKNL